MAEKTFRSPGFFEKELVITPEEQESIAGVPAGVIGTSQSGPAFVPITVGTFGDFAQRFGTVNPKNPAVYAVKEYFDQKEGPSALTFVRVLGAGANNTDADILNTSLYGYVKNAGFKLNPETSLVAGDSRHDGSVQFISAIHEVQEVESFANPQFTDNDSFDTGDYTATEEVNLIRAMLLTATGSRFIVLDHDGENFSDDTGADLDDLAKVSSKRIFKLALSSSAGASFANEDDGTTKYPGVKFLSCSLDPESSLYISKVLNTDPKRFAEEKHLLYAHFPVETEYAKLKYDSGNETIAIVSGSGVTNTNSLTFRETFGRFDARFQAAKTTSFISQPFGSKEFDLFHVEAISDGAAENNKYKISITSVKKSTDPNNPYGTFGLQVRDFYDTDKSATILEEYSNLSLDPDNANYIAKVIGDVKVSYKFDTTIESEHRVVVSGKYGNKSKRIRVIMSSDVEKRLIPREALPFGFRGLPTLKTSVSLTDRPATVLSSDFGTAQTISNARLAASGSSTKLNFATGSIVPPVPFRFKCTKGEVTAGGNLNDQGLTGFPSISELADSSLYWGVKFERIALETETTNAGRFPNAIPSLDISPNNELIENYAKFLGIQKLNQFSTGLEADAFNNNKFSLSKVALDIEVDAAETAITAIENHLTGTASEHIRGTAYIRNSSPRAIDLTVEETGNSSSRRITLGTLANLTSSLYFNKFVNFTKFSNMMYGGWDGINILHSASADFGDRATSTETGGLAVSGHISPGFGSHLEGANKDNTAIQSYQHAIRIMNDSYTVGVNILAIPGIREPFVTNEAIKKVEDYGKSIFLMDIQQYDEDSVRIFDDRPSSKKPAIDKTVELFELRGVDSNYASSYFPDIRIKDDINFRRVRVPASVAALSALSLNDARAYPWFAPAGFNRASLENVTAVDSRLNASERDEIYDARLNPIASFPDSGYVIFGQKTLQVKKSALDRVNVRRMVLEAKRRISSIANDFVFEPNDQQTRERFVGRVAAALTIMRAEQGVDRFAVICDETNNTENDVNNNRLNAKIVLVPTRAVEYIEVTFVIDPSGVSFA